MIINKHIQNYILFLFSLLLSCSNKQNITKDLTLLQSKPIVLSIGFNFIAKSRDIIVSDFMLSDLKLLVYSDPTSCSSCELNKMYIWDKLIEYEKSYNGRLRYYFIYSPKKKDINSFMLNIKNSSFNYPVLLDTLGDFEKLNPHLPKNKAMHTFLLDENNKVILVGNPLHNKEIEKLFYKKTQELLSK